MSKHRLPTRRLSSTRIPGGSNRTYLETSSGKSPSNPPIYSCRHGTRIFPGPLSVPTWRYVVKVNKLFATWSYGGGNHSHMGSDSDLCIRHQACGMSFIVQAGEPNLRRWWPLSGWHCIRWDDMIPVTPASKVPAGKQTVIPHAHSKTNEAKLQAFRPKFTAKPIEIVDKTGIPWWAVCLNDKCAWWPCCFKELNRHYSVVKKIMAPLPAKRHLILLVILFPNPASPMSRTGIFIGNSLLNSSDPARLLPLARTIDISALGITRTAGSPSSGNLVGHLKTPFHKGPVPWQFILFINCSLTIRKYCMAPEQISFLRLFSVGRKHLAASTDGELFSPSRKPSQAEPTVLFCPSHISAIRMVEIRILVHWYSPAPYVAVHGSDFSK